MANRELKFKVWNPEQKEWAFTIDMSQNPMYWADKMKDEFILCQSTGLRDRNGREIYESDILAIADEIFEDVTGYGQGVYEPINHLVEVEFRDGAFGCELPGGAQLFQKRFYNLCEIIDDYGIESLEVIGDIFTTPGLLSKSS